MALYDIADRIARAKGMVEEGEYYSFLYAVLELRFCFEFIAYKNLAAYGEFVSLEIAKEWRPDKVIQLLAEFDPWSSDTAEFAISKTMSDVERVASTEGSCEGVEGEGFIPVGVARRIPWRKFRRHYNALGSFLHLGKDLDNVLPTRQKLNELIASLEDVASSSIIAAVTDVATAQCDCGEVLVLGPAQRSGGKAIFCPSVRCNRTYVVIKDDPENRIALVQDVGFPCAQCEAIVRFTPERLLKPATCPSCKAVVRVLFSNKAMVLSQSHPSVDDY